MEKKEVIFTIPEGKKHSVCYKTTAKDAAVQSIYVMRTALGNNIPKKIKITIEEVE
jgi:hypothetical protein